MRKYLQILYLIKNLCSECVIYSYYNSVGIQTTQLKYGQNIRIDSSPKRYMNEQCTQKRSSASLVAKGMPVKITKEHHYTYAQ